MSPDQPCPDPAESPPRRPRPRPAGPPNPFETFLLAICVVQGWAVITGVAQPNSIQTLLPATLRFVWALLLLVGGIFSISGLYWFDQFTGIEIKRVGLLCAAGGTLAYGVALLAVGPPGFLAGATNLSFAAACIVRIWQVSRALKAARGRMAAMRPPRRPLDGDAH